MAISLDQTQRKLVASALASYATQLDSSTTGNPTVDTIISEQAEEATSLSELFSTGTRASVSTPSND